MSKPEFDLHPEAGTVLIISLALLVLMGIFALGAAQNSLLTVQLTKNIKGQMLVNQALENALLSGAVSLSATRLFAIPQENEPCVFRSGQNFAVLSLASQLSRKSLSSRASLAGHLDCSLGSLVHDLLVESSGLAIQLSYVLEYLGPFTYRSDTLTVEKRTLFFRITVFGEIPGTGIHSAMEALYTRDFNLAGASLSELEEASRRRLVD